MGVVVIFLLTTWADMVQKCDVLPLSAIARESGGISLGGPTVGAEVKQHSESLETLVEETTLLFVGSPHRQSLLEARFRARRARPELMVLLPPFILKAVASSLCPSALRRQVMEVWFLAGLRPWVQQ